MAAGKKKRLVIAAVLLFAVSVLLLAAAGLEVKKKGLPREKDTEFDSGSRIGITALSEIQTESLYKLCKVWGYTKYHHPAVISGEYNWDAELFRVMPDILKADEGSGANEILTKWLEAFPVEGKRGADAKIWKQVQEETGKKVLDTSWIGDTAWLGEELSEYLCSMSDLYISERDHAYASFEKSGVVSFENERMYSVSDGDMGMKLLGLFRFWNMYEYYSPNVEITVEDWDEVLKKAIPLVAEAADYRSYVLAIAQAVSKTGDAHITIADKEKLLYYYYGKNFLPCSIKMIDGQAVINQTMATTGLMAGDILLAIDGMKIGDRIEEQRQYLPLPESDKLLNKMEHLLLETKGTEAEVRIRREGQEKTVRVKTQKYQYHYKNPVENGLLDDENIGYIDPSALEAGGLERLMKEFEDTQGIIVDLRYYPSTPILYLLGEYIVQEQKTFSIIGMPNQAMPGAYWQREMTVGKGIMKEQENDVRTFRPYHGKVVILMDESTQSQSEFTVMALRQSPNATVVGSPSIGADGNIVKLSLPDSVILHISGLGVYTPEGGQTQRCGLKPDVTCYPTVEGIRAGRDELLEKAVEIIETDTKASGTRRGVE